MKEIDMQETVFTCDTCPKEEAAVVRLLSTRAQFPDRWASVVVSINDANIVLHVCEDCLVERSAIGQIAVIVTNRLAANLTIVKSAETSRKRRVRS